MSRRDSREPFVMFPNRFIDAWMRGDLTDRQAKLLFFVARHANQQKREAKLTLAGIVAGADWQVSESTLARDLRSVQPEWIDYELKPGQRRPYVIRLTGLAVAREGDENPLPEAATSARPPHDLRKKAPQEPPHGRNAETGETHKPSGKAPPQEPPHDSDDSPLPLTSTEGSEVKAASEEKLDHVVGKTTAADLVPEFPKLLDRLEPNPFHRAERNGGPPLRVEQADDGSLVWSAEPVEGEQGVLDDVRALVDAGLAEWIEDDAEGER